MQGRELKFAGTDNVRQQRVSPPTQGRELKYPYVRLLL